MNVITCISVCELQSYYDDSSNYWSKHDNQIFPSKSCIEKSACSLEIGADFYCQIV